MKWSRNYFYFFYLITFFILYSSLTGRWARNGIDLVFMDYFLIIIVTVLFRQTIYVCLSFLFDIKYVWRRVKFAKKYYRPLVSVIIPAWNEEKGIIATVESVLRSSYDNIEIIVVNDGSTDNTDRLMRDYLHMFKKTNVSTKKLYYIYQENKGKGGALNTGIKKSSGDIIMTLDADSMLDKEAIVNAVEVFKDPQIMAAAGCIRVGNKQSFLGFVQYIEYLTTFMLKKSDDILQSLYIVGGANAFFRRQIFNKIGLFKTDTITEDIEMSMRIQKHGMKIAYIPDTVVITEGAQDFVSLIKQRVRWRRGRYQIIFQVHRDLFFKFRKGNLFLSWITLPYSVFMELVLFIEPFSFAFLVFLSIKTGSTLSFFLLFIITLLFFLFSFITSYKLEKKANFLFYIPVAWIMYYFAALVEYVALMRSLFSSFFGKEEKWQRWRRNGLVKEEIIIKETNSNSLQNEKNVVIYHFFVLPVRVEKFKKVLFDIADLLKDQFFIYSVNILHKRKKHLTVWYCYFELRIYTLSKQGAFLVKNRFNDLIFDKLVWMSSYHDTSFQENNMLEARRTVSEQILQDKVQYKTNCTLCSVRQTLKTKSGIFKGLHSFLMLETLLLSLILISLIVFFYVNFFFFYKKENNFLHTLFFMLLFTVSTDGLMLFVNAFRKRKKNFHHNKKAKFDPSLVTCIISSYNGASVIGETIRQVMYHLPKEQIIVVSDKSTDNTAEVARRMGVRVIENEINLNKAFSISKAVNYVKTPLVLLMDDDVYIKDVFLPTSLITDKGYRAVAFNVLPKKTGTFVNLLQIFEYRKSMFFSKALRSRIGAVSNVSGAIGLFLREDVDIQKTYHSGQFGGEDQQRTIFVHLLSNIALNKNYNKGVTFYPSTVYTDVPDTWRALFRQRSYSWGMATHENFFLFCKVLFSSNAHLLLKIDRAYLLFIFFTEPLRMFIAPFLFFHLLFLGVLLFLYFVLENISWLRTGRKDPYIVVLASPFYNIFKLITRFISYFYWFKVKFVYLQKRFHTLVVSRNLIKEYSVITLIIFLLFFLSSYIFVKIIL